MSNAETIYYYLQKLEEVGIKVPEDVMLAAQELWNKQRERMYGK